MRQINAFPLVEALPTWCDGCLDLSVCHNRPVDDRTALQQRLGMAVRDARSRRGLSIEAAAKDAGISPVTWRRVERGQGVYEPTMRKVESYFGVPDGSITTAFSSTEAMTAFAARLDNLDVSTTPATRDHLRNTDIYLHSREAASDQGARHVDLSLVAEKAAEVITSISPEDDEAERETLTQRVVHQFISNDTHTLEDIYDSVGALLLFYEREIGPAEREYADLATKLIELARSNSRSTHFESDIKEAEAKLASLESSLDARRTVLMGVIRGMQTSVVTILVRNALER